jgi:hypothetical protein
MNNFTFDGIRFGAMQSETRSGSMNDERLTRRSEAIVTAAWSGAHTTHWENGFLGSRSVTNAPDPCAMPFSLRPMCGIRASRTRARVEECLWCVWSSRSCANTKPGTLP